MCRQHLLGEHVEAHMILGSLKRQKSIAGFVAKNCIEPARLQARHDELAAEMARRGMNHKSPLLVTTELEYLPAAHREARVDVDSALADLYSRCPRCKNLEVDA
jgi:hypothetical protein